MNGLRHAILLVYGEGKQNLPFALEASQCDFWTFVSATKRFWLLDLLCLILESLSRYTGSGIFISN